MRIGLTFDEYYELNLKPPVGADRAFQQAAKMERDEMFPMPTSAASHHLRSRGYDCRPAMLDVLTKNGVVKLAKPDVWTQADVDAAADHFEECEIFVPYAAMCQTLGCSYADFKRPLREASERESQEYGRHIPADDQMFVMHRMPPRGDMPSVLSFTPFSKHTEPANPTTATGVTGSGSICQTLHFSMPARWLSFWDCFNARPVA